MGGVAGGGGEEYGTGVADGVAGLTAGDGDAVGGVVAGGVGAGVVSDDGVVLGAGLEEDAQPARSRPTTSVVARREPEERIRCPLDGVQQETLGCPDCYARNLSACLCPNRTPRASPGVRE